MNVKVKWVKGKTAPYKTVMVRTPEPIKPEVERIINEYKEKVLSQAFPDEVSVEGTKESSQDEVGTEQPKPRMTREEAIALAKKGSKKKESEIPGYIMQIINGLSGYQENEG